ncbi:MAG TPA: class I SAM-dependent methyltransferase [Solirubrobacteraceae bacterium]|nr:class I SAM-dependent methyltransferase [Solirubrobacteraceae bacterium]
MNAPTASPVTERWQRFFSHPAYVRFASVILDPERTAREVAAIRRVLALESGARVLDLGCGYGRIAVPLARAGCRVTGLDASEPMLELARERADAEGVELELVHTDMRELGAIEEFDAVVSVGTALGYVEARHGDAAAIAAAARALVPGGRLLIDTENREAKLRMEPQVSFPMAGTTVWCDRSYDHLTGRWHERMSWGEGETADEAEYSLRLYTAVEVVDMLDAAGLRVDGLWADFDEAPFATDAARMAVRAVKR